MTKNIVGLMLVDAPHSALNNSGSDAGDRTDNAVKVKTIRRGREIYPYVSGQAWRYWWRSTLEDRFNWIVSPIERTEKIAFTAADPLQYSDDDVFGYMRAEKKAKATKTDHEKTKKKTVTLTRASPLKNSPLISVLSQRPTDDFGVMTRQKDGDPVPYEHQFYSTVLKGIFSLNIDMVGKFSSMNKSGFKNLNDIEKETLDKYNATVNDNLVVLPREHRLKRAQDAISSLKYISGGAKQSSHLTDITPKLIVLACINGGNHPFMNVVKEKEQNIYFDFNAFKQTISDYKDSFLSDIYIGHNQGFLDQLIPEFEKITSDGINGLTIRYQSIGESLDSMVQEMEHLMD